MAGISCVDTTYTVSPESPQSISHVFDRNDNCTWTVNVAPEYQQVSISLLGWDWRRLHITSNHRQTSVNVLNSVPYSRNLVSRTFISLPPANEVWGKVIFSEACVKNSVHSGEVPGQVPPREVTPPGSHTPPRRYTTLPARHPPADTPPGQTHPWD